MQILYLGQRRGTSHIRALALRRLGHDVRTVDPYSFVGNSRVVHKWIYETGGLFLERFVSRSVLRETGGSRFDVVWVDGGELVGPSLVRELKRRSQRVVNYNHDDPFGAYRSKWRLYSNSLPYYDLAVVVRQPNIEEATRRGAAKVSLVYRSADEVAHAPREITDSDRQRWASDVVFIGTWVPERGPFMADLVSRQVPLAIYGDRWHKAKEWPILKPHWRGPNLSDPDDYAKAVQCARICLGLLSKGNRDLHTQRSTEIPYLGGLLCAERTAEHTYLYKEGEEAVFWGDAAECAERCHFLLRNDEQRRKIARAGKARCLRNGYTSERVMAGILDTVLGG
ncbi:MAG: glycosyltransferase [Terriglobales bacterium]